MNSITSHFCQQSSEQVREKLSGVVVLARMSSTPYLGYVDLTTERLIVHRSLDSIETRDSCLDSLVSEIIVQMYNRRKTVI